MGDQKDHFDLEPIGGEDADLEHSDIDQPSPPAAPAPSRESVVEPVAPIDAPPLLELAEDKCPKCGTVLSHDAVFCIKCGYDMRTNETRTPTLGVEHVFEKPKEEEPVFAAPGRGSIKMLLAIGGAITLGAMVIAGLNAPPRFLPVVANVLLCLYETALHTGTGVVAVLIAARVAELKLGSLELAAARVFVAFSAFQLLHSINFGQYQLLVTLLMYPIALATYWALIMLLFRKPRMVALHVLIAHFVLWVAVQLGMELTAYARSVPAAKVVEPAPAG